jgi:RimJ/RimL family protein N-acetyltransferase
MGLGLLNPVNPDISVLEGNSIQLEPLEHRHLNGLVTAASADPDLYRWTPVPQGVVAAREYMETALAWQHEGTALPFAIVRAADGIVIGSTRFFNIERWPWPVGHERHGRGAPDACEIGYTWLTSGAIRTAANTESKLLMLRYAFEEWKVLRVCFHTDSRNHRSRAALERIGGKFEGILRAHRLAVDNIARDSARFSIIAAEWPEVESRLIGFLSR